MLLPPQREKKKEKKDPSLHEGNTGSQTVDTVYSRKGLIAMLWYCFTEITVIISCAVPLPVMEPLLTLWQYSYCLSKQIKNLGVLRPVNQCGYIRLTHWQYGYCLSKQISKYLGVLCPVNQCGYIRFTHWQYSYCLSKQISTLVFYAQSTSAVTSGSHTDSTVTVWVSK